jgi:hypothetical protein
VLKHIVAPVLTLGLVNPGAAPTANDAAEANVETVLNSLELPIDLHHVDAFVEAADGLHMQVDYHIALGHVTIATRMDQNGTGVARLTLNQRVLAEQEFVDGKVTTESTAFGALTAEEAYLLAAGVYQVWEHDDVIKVMAETRGLLCGIAAGLSFLAISAGVIAGCELATSGLGTAACVTLGGGLGKETGAIAHDKCQKAQN